MRVYAAGWCTAAAGDGAQSPGHGRVHRRRRLGPARSTAEPPRLVADDERRGPPTPAAARLRPIRVVSAAPHGVRRCPVPGLPVVPRLPARRPAAIADLVQVGIRSV